MSVTTNPLKANQVEPYAEQENLGPGWKHVVRGGRVIKASSPSNPKLAPGTFIESRTRNEVRNTRAKGKTASQSRRTR